MSGSSGPNWADVLGGIGAIAGIGSAIVAGLAKRDSRNSAKASRDSADEAAKVRQIESDRQHDDMRPKALAKIETEVRNGTLWGSITVQDRDYRVSAVGLHFTGGEQPLEVPHLLRANQPHDFPIEPWPHDATEPKTREIRFRFWPPAEDDGATSWTCRCGRPTGETLDGPSHWEWVVPVVWERPKNRIARL